MFKTYNGTKVGSSSQFSILFTDSLQKEERIIKSKLAMFLFPEPIGQ